MSSREWTHNAKLECIGCKKVFRGHISDSVAECLGGWDQWYCIRCLTMFLEKDTPTKPKCIICKKKLDYKVTKMDRVIDDNIYYCDDCFDIGMEDIKDWDDYDQDDR